MECRHEEYEDHDEVDRYCHPHDGYKCAGFRPDVRSSLWTYRRDCACTSPRQDDLPALRPTELCDVPAQASRHLWRILELRQYWRRQPGLQRDAAHLVGLDQKQRGRTEPPPSIFFCRRSSPTPDMSVNDVRFRRWSRPLYRWISRGLKRSVWRCDGIWLRTHRCAGRLLFADG